MLFNIPQFIDKEDKIVGPFTAKQLGWMAGGATVLMVLWAILDVSGFWVAAIPVCALTAALAFYHPNGQPLISFIFSSIGFAFHPKIYIWRRIAEKEEKKKVEKKKVEAVKVHRETNTARMEEIGRLLDQK